MRNWNGLEGYVNGSIYSRLNGIPVGVHYDSYVLCTIPRLFTPHCTKELQAADDIQQEFKDCGIPIIFASTDSPEVAEQFFGKNPVSFPFIRISLNVDRDLGAIDRFGDAHRATYFIKENTIKDVDVYDFNSERDMWKVLNKAKGLLL